MQVTQLFAQHRSVIKMPWPSCSPSNVVEVVFCRTKCDKMAVIHQDYYFHHNRKYKGGDYWCCAQRGCKVRLISSSVDHETGRMEFSRRNKTIQHQHPPNAPNLIEKDFRRQLVTQLDRFTAGENGPPQPATAASVRLVYDQLRLQAIERGVPENLIPSFWNVRSTMYRIRRKRELLQPPTNPDSDKRENNATSAGEGSNRSGSSAPESPESCAAVTSPEQTEPLCLVTWKRNNSLAEEHRPLQTPPIMHHSPVSSGSVFRRDLMPIDPDLLRYSSNYPPSFFPTVPTDQSIILQHYAALHAEYLRSLVALNMYPHY